MDQKKIFGEAAGYGDSYSEFVFRCFKVLRLQAILRDAAGAVRSYSGKGQDDPYKIGEGPNSCSLGPVTGLRYCLYVKLFPPPIFKSIDI